MKISQVSEGEVMIYSKTASIIFLEKLSLFVMWLYCLVIHDRSQTNFLYVQEKQRTSSLPLAQHIIPLTPSLPLAQHIPLTPSLPCPPQTSNLPQLQHILQTQVKYTLLQFIYTVNVRFESHLHEAVHFSLKKDRWAVSGVVV